MYILYFRKKSWICRGIFKWSLENLTKESRKGWIVQESVEGVRRRRNSKGICGGCTEKPLAADYPHLSINPITTPSLSFFLSRSLSVSLFSLSFCLYPSPSLSLSLSLTHFLSLSYSLSLTLFLSLSHSLSLSLSLSFPLSLTLFPSLSHSLSLSLFASLSLSLSNPLSPDYTKPF